MLGARIARERRGDERDRPAHAARGRRDPLDAALQRAGPVGRRHARSRRAARRPGFPCAGIRSTVPAGWRAIAASTLTACRALRITRPRAACGRTGCCGATRRSRRLRSRCSRRSRPSPGPRIPEGHVFCPDGLAHAPGTAPFAHAVVALPGDLAAVAAAPADDPRRAALVAWIARGASLLVPTRDGRRSARRVVRSRPRPLPRRCAAARGRRRPAAPGGRTGERLHPRRPPDLARAPPVPARTQAGRLRPPRRARRRRRRAAARARRRHRDGRPRAGRRGRRDAGARPGGRRSGRDRAHRDRRRCRTRAARMPRERAPARRQRRAGRARPSRGDRRHRVPVSRPRRPHPGRGGDARGARAHAWARSTRRRATPCSPRAPRRPPGSSSSCCARERPAHAARRPSPAAAAGRSLRAAHRRHRARAPRRQRRALRARDRARAGAAPVAPRGHAARHGRRE